MIPHLRANLILLLSTLVLCAVLYPLVLLGVGKVAFPRMAEGSLVTTKDAEGKDKVVGSQLIAQSFSGDEYFQPRPSAVSYNAAGSGGSNLGPNNPVLRDRVARQLGNVVKYGRRSPKAGEPVGPDIDQWLHDNPKMVDRWAERKPGAAGLWLGADKANAELVADWKKAKGSEDDATADDVRPYFASIAARPLDTWPDDVRTQVRAVFFETWLETNPDKELEPVPADMVMTSGSGLDPHITLDNALYQLDRVADGWVKKNPKLNRSTVKQEIEKLLRDHASAPLGGLVGVPLVNVLEVNLALREKYGRS